MRVEMILARRKSRARTGAGLLHHGGDKKNLISPTSGRVLPPRKHVSTSTYSDPNKEKLAYEYLVKFKNASYLHTKWLTYFQIGELILI